MVIRKTCAWLKEIKNAPLGGKCNNPRSLRFNIPEYGQAELLFTTCGGWMEKKVGYKLKTQQ